MTFVKNIKFHEKNKEHIIYHLYDINIYGSRNIKLHNIKLRRSYIKSYGDLTIDVTNGLHFEYRRLHPKIKCQQK